MGESEGLKRPALNTRKILNFGVGVGFFKIYTIWGASLVKKGPFFQEKWGKIQGSATVRGVVMGCKVIFLT